MNRPRNLSRGLMCLVVPAFLMAATVQANDLTPAEIDALAVRAMERFQTPGIAIGVVKNGELVYAAGHGGGLQGMTSSLTLLPELNVAVIALTNQMNIAPIAVTSEILQAAVSAPPEDWLEIFADADDERYGNGRKAVEDAFANRNTESTPTMALEAYAGTYRDPWYGDVFVELDGDRLVIRFGRSELLTGGLEHFQYDTFIARWENRSLHGDAYVSFSISADGEVESIRMKGLSPNTDVSFDYHDLDLTRVAAE